MKPLILNFQEPNRSDFSEKQSLRTVTDSRENMDANSNVNVFSFTTLTKTRESQDNSCFLGGRLKR
jgi:hypothetical protein